MGPFDSELQLWPETALYTLVGSVVGLLVSAMFLSFARPGLRAGFFGRYGLMVLAICLAGAMMGPLLILSTIFLGTDEFVPSRPPEFVSLALYATAAGGVLGAVEGVVLGFPLAALLGRFGDPTVVQEGLQP